jgi:RNA polymerase sigma-70 factor (ECF subfamily)
LPTDETYNETDLLLRLADGDTSAFDALYNYYQPKLYLYIFPFSRRSKQDTEEIIQEIFLKLWVRKATLPAINSFPQYLFRMAKNLFLSKLEKRKMKVVSLDQLPGTVSNDLDASGGMVLKEYTAAAQAAIAGLPEQRRKIFLMRFENDMSLDEISTELGIAKPTAKNQLYSAVRQVRAYLKENGGWPKLFILLIIRHLD